MRRPPAVLKMTSLLSVTEDIQLRPVTGMCISIEEAWKLCGGLYCQAAHVPRPIDSEVIDREILFCILGGFGITYELCLSATASVATLRPFASEWNDDDLFRALSSMLGQPRFEPRRPNGSLRRYRFPNRKASLVVETRRWRKRHSPLEDLLESLPTAQARRDLLCGCPGFGLKSASWLLRNLGWGEDLAIIDVHLIRALTDAGRIGNVRMPRDYELAERAFLHWCHELDAPAAAFDLFVWEWQRGNFLPQ